MSDIIIIPYDGIGKVHFGNNREIVRDNLGSYKEFRKTKFSTNTTDDFGFCHAFYTKDNTLEAIEFFPEAQLLYKDKALFSFSLSEIKTFFADNGIKEDDCGARFPKYGVSVYAPNGDKIESIMIYSKSYFDD